MIHLNIENLSKSFGDLVLFENISFAIESNQRIGLIARNGAGKTTLLNIIAGRESIDSGNVMLMKGVRVGYLNQDPEFDTNLSVLDACFSVKNDTTKAIKAYEQALESGNANAINEAMILMDHLQAWDYEVRIKQILSQLKIENFTQKVGELSGGQVKRVGLAAVLISDPEFIILDEPTNHLDMEMVEWLEGFLNRGNISLLMVTHDRYFLDRVCNEIIEIDNQTIFRYKGNYSYYLEKRDERIEAFNTEVERAKNLYKTELDWMRRQPQARATKAKYRIDAFYKLEEKAKQQINNSNVQLDVKATYIGSKIFEIEKLCKAFGKKKIIEDFSYIFGRYEKLGIVGNNGTGKSTFIKMLMGEVQPDSGTIEIGETVKFGYFSQQGLAFDDQMKVIDVVQNVAEVIEVGNKTLTASQFLQHFLFVPEKQHNYVYKLSGGEKRRLHLCTVLMQNPNFLVLDEPTNDLDIATLNILEDYLQSFKGCVIVVSHDRYFMDKVVDHILVFKGEGDLQGFAGNYTDYRDWNEEYEKIIAEREAAEKQKKKAVEPVATVQPESKKKLSFKERKEYETLEADIEKLENEKAELESKLQSGTLTPEELQKISERYGVVEGLIDDKSMRWLELSEFA